MLRDSRDGASRLLLAKVYVRLQEYQAAVAVLSKAKFETPALRGVAEILLASATERMSLGTPFDPKIDKNASPHVLALRDYYAALSAWRRGEIEAMGDLAKRAADAGDAETRAFATDLLAWVANSNGRPDLATRLFLSVLDQLGRGDVRDEHLRINAIQALAFTAVESLNLGALARIEKELRAVSVTEFTSRPYLGALLSMAALYGLAGEDEKQFRTLLVARAVNVPSPFAALADTLLATFHRNRGEMSAARMHISFASDAVEDTDWPNSDVEQRVAAVAFAAEAAAQRDRRAGPAYTRAVSFRGKQDLALRFEHDVQAAAQGHFARGRLAEMRHDLDAAAEAYQEAVSRWTKQGDRYRSALASIELLRLEGNIQISKGLRDAVRDAPKSWFSREVSRLRKDAASPFAQLSPAELRVLEKICEGSTSRQIAEELDRSPSTVRNQTISIFRKFGVSTRTALVAQVKAHG